MKSVGLVKESAVLVIFAFFSGALTAAPAFGMPVHEPVNAEKNGRSVHEDSVAKDLQEFEVVSERVRKEVISTAPLFSMNEERMKVMGVTDISDALHRLPGVNIRDYGGNPENVPADSIAARLSDMVDMLTLRGYRPMFYSNEQGYERFLYPTCAGMPLWICSFNENMANGNWTFWQYDHRGKVPGIRGDVDLDVFSGNREQWKQHLRQFAK